MDTWDVVIIGGGAAGMMAAGVAARHGAKVMLLEKNTTLGKKLLISGGGRCNVTNAEFDTRLLLSKYKSSEKFLASPFTQWDSQKTLDFFTAHNMPTKIEPEKRAFPMSDTAQSVWDVLANEMQMTGVTIRSQSPAIHLEYDAGAVTGVQLKSGEVIRAVSYIMATGGLSHPETGSTGDGFKMLHEVGHTINVAQAALVPIAVAENWIKDIAGISMSDVKITVFQYGKKVHKAIGKILFTHVGLSGPGILNMSSTIGTLLPNGDVTVELDLIADYDYSSINRTLQETFKEHHIKKISNSLSELIPKGLVATVLNLSQIDPDTPCNSITRDQRIMLGRTLKHFTVTVTHLLGTDKAIITSGGVPLNEIDTKYMRSRKYSNLYIIGDLLDIDRPSGGYSLQLCWTTGYVAATSIQKNT